MPAQLIQEAVCEGDIEEAEALAVQAVSGPAGATYGEITPRGFGTLGARLCISSDDAFADLGSGLGRVVVQSITQFDAASACGVELSKTRHERALLALEKVESSVHSRVQLIHGDAADESLWDKGPLAATTVVWLSALLFSPEVPGRERAAAVVT